MSIDLEALLSVNPPPPLLPAPVFLLFSPSSFSALFSTPSPPSYSFVSSSVSHFLCTSCPVVFCWGFVFTRGLWGGLVSPGVICISEQGPRLQRHEPGQSEFPPHPPHRHHILSSLFRFATFSFSSALLLVWLVSGFVCFVFFNSIRHERLR